RHAVRPHPSIHVDASKSSGRKGQMSTTNIISSHAAFIEAEHASTLASYRARPDNIRENAGQEQAIVQGGYRQKQVQELIQNAVDALGPEGGLVQVTLTEEALYVANRSAEHT